MRLYRFFLPILLLLSCLTGPAIADASTDPGDSARPVLQHGDTYAFMVGDVRVTALSDGTVPLDLPPLLHGITGDQISRQLKQAYLSNPVETSINAFLLAMEDHIVLVDTGVGGLFGPDIGGQLLTSLHAAGYAPEDITDILLSHIHSDHIGGLTRNGHRVFDNATIHVSKQGLQFFMNRRNAQRTGYAMHYFAQAIDILTPYVEANQIKTFDSETEILPGITATIHPGHTPGMAFYTLASDGRKITFIGDLIHVASIQFPNPAVTISFDLKPEQAAQSRKTALARFAANRTLIAGPHLPFPGVGHVRKVEEGYDWVPINYANRKNGQAGPQLNPGQ